MPVIAQTISILRSRFMQPKVKTSDLKILRPLHSSNFTNLYGNFNLLDDSGFELNDGDDPNEGTNSLANTFCPGTKGAASTFRDFVAVVNSFISASKPFSSTPVWSQLSGQLVWAIPRTRWTEILLKLFRNVCLFQLHACMTRYT